jgi:hypothetical protein
VYVPRYSYSIEWQHALLGGLQYALGIFCSCRPSAAGHPSDVCGSGRLSDACVLAWQTTMRTLVLQAAVALVGVSTLWCAAPSSAVSVRGGAATLAPPPPPARALLGHDSSDPSVDVDEALMGVQNATQTTSEAPLPDSIAGRVKAREVRMLACSAPLQPNCERRMMSCRQSEGGFGR